MIDDSRLILISYPSGGFGNFIYYMLTEFSSNTYKVDNSNFNFNELGNSHKVNKYIPIWSKDPDYYTLPQINTDKKLLMLCDNGINNDSYEKIKSNIKFDKIVRLNIDYEIRPVIFTTCVIKAMNSDLYSTVADAIKQNWTDSNEDYAIRENFTLLYHNWPFNWSPVKDPTIINVSIKDLIDDPVNTLTVLIKSIGGEVILQRPFKYFCDKWYRANHNFFTIYYNWKDIENSLNSNNSLDLTHITDLHEQGYINYCIEKKYQITVPVYDYKNWFQNTNDIKEMVTALCNK